MSVVAAISLPRYAVSWPAVEPVIIAAVNLEEDSVREPLAWSLVSGCLR